MPVDELAEHLARYQGARGTLDRLRATTATARTLAGLSTSERSALARALTERGVPELAARVDPAWVGRLGPDDLTRVAQALQSLDEGQRTGLVTTLRDQGDEPPAPGLPPPPPPSPTLADVREADPQPTPAPTAPPEVPPPAATAVVADDRPPAVDIDDGAHHDGVGDEVADDEAADDEATAHDDVPGPVDDVETRTATEPAPVAATADLTGDLAALRSASSPRERFAVADTLVDARLDNEGVLSLVRAVPDGWQRRMFVRRLLDVAVPVDLDAAAVVTAFDRATDRTAVVHALVRAGIAHVDHLADHLPARAADRLRHRGAHRPTRTS